MFKKITPACKSYSGSLGKSEYRKINSNLVWLNNLNINNIMTQEKKGVKSFFLDK